MKKIGMECTLSKMYDCKCIVLRHNNILKVYVSGTGTFGFIGTVYRYRLLKKKKKKWFWFPIHYGHGSGFHRFQIKYKIKFF